MAELTVDSTLHIVDSTFETVSGESLVSRELGKIATEYREAERFRAYLVTVLEQVQEAAQVASRIPDFFDINTAVGEQLTFIGNRLGFPRCHCVCDATPVLGFACDTPMPGPPIAGACEGGIWRGCGGNSNHCLYDDEGYRAHLVARRYQMLGLYDIDSLSASIRAVWGDTAWVAAARNGRVILAPGRALTSLDAARLSVTLRVLPIVPTMEIALHYGILPILGFGAGWAGACADVTDAPVLGFVCDGVTSPYALAGACETGVRFLACLSSPRPAGEWLCPIVVDPYACGEPPLLPALGFEGLDTDVIVAGAGDETATWAACV